LRDDGVGLWANLVDFDSTLFEAGYEGSIGGWFGSCRVNIVAVTQAIKQMAVNTKEDERRSGWRVSEH
jgi:hypothetical protein